MEKNLVTGRGGLSVMDNYVFAYRNAKEATLGETERITGTLEEIVAALEKRIENESSWDNPNQYYNNPTGHAALKNVATGETYGPGTCFPGEWMSDSDIQEMCVEVIDPEVEAELGFDPNSESYRDDCDPYTFMVLTKPLEYEPDRVRKWIDFIHDTTDGIGRGFCWTLMKQ